MLRDEIGKAVALNINEIYKSIQGEGFLVGSPCIFVRIQGCNIRCPWCDQPSSLSFVERKMNIEDIFEHISKYGCRHVVITGGEPFTEQNIKHLCALLLEENYLVQIETNGTLWIEGMEKLLDKIYLSCSPKEEAGFRIDERFVDFINELKFVIDERFDASVLERKEFKPFVEKGLVILQPENNRKEMIIKAINIQDEFIKKGYSLKVIPQIHKILGVK